MNKQGWITFGGTNWILTDLINSPSVYFVDWLKVEWGAIFYYWVISTVLMFIGSFVFRNMCKNQKTYYLILIVYILSLVGFGNLVPTYYHGVNGNIVKDGTSATSNNDLKLHQPLITYIISCFIPQYHLNVFLMKAMDNGIINGQASSKYSPTWWNLGSVSAFSWSSDWHWNFSLLFPPAVLVFLSLITWRTIEWW